MMTGITPSQRRSNVQIGTGESSVANMGSLRPGDVKNSVRTGPGIAAWMRAAL